MSVIYEQISSWRPRKSRSHWLTTTKGEHGILNLIIVLIIITLPIIIPEDKVNPL